MLELSKITACLIFPQTHSGFTLHSDLHKFLSENKINGFCTTLLSRTPLS